MNSNTRIIPWQVKSSETGTKNSMDAYRPDIEDDQFRSRRRGRKKDNVCLMVDGEVSFETFACQDQKETKGKRIKGYSDCTPPKTGLITWKWRSMSEKKNTLCRRPPHFLVPCRTFRRWKQCLTGTRSKTHLGLILASEPLPCPLQIPCRKHHKSYVDGPGTAAGDEENDDYVLCTPCWWYLSRKRWMFNCELWDSCRVTIPMSFKLPNFQTITRISHEKWYSKILLEKISGVRVGNLLGNICWQVAGRPFSANKMEKTQAINLVHSET